MVQNNKEEQRDLIEKLEDFEFSQTILSSITTNCLCLQSSKKRPPPLLVPNHGSV